MTLFVVNDVNGFPLCVPWVQGVAFACRCSMPSAFFFSSFLERNEVAPKRSPSLLFSAHKCLTVSSLAAWAHSESRRFSGTIQHISFERNKTLALYPRRQKQHRLINIYFVDRKEKKIYVFYCKNRTRENIETCFLKSYSLMFYFFVLFCWIVSVFGHWTASSCCCCFFYWADHTHKLNDQLVVFLPWFVHNSSFWEGITSGPLAITCGIRPDRQRDLRYKNQYDLFTFGPEIYFKGRKMALNGSRNGAHVQSFQFHKKKKKRKENLL